MRDEGTKVPYYYIYMPSAKLMSEKNSKIFSGFGHIKILFGKSLKRKSLRFAIIYLLKCARGWLKSRILFILLVYIYMIQY